MNKLLLILICLFVYSCDSRYEKIKKNYVLDLDDIVYECHFKYEMVYLFDEVYGENKYNNPEPISEKDRDFKMLFFFNENKKMFGWLQHRPYEDKGKKFTKFVYPNEKLEITDKFITYTDLENMIEEVNKENYILKTTQITFREPKSYNNPFISWKIRIEHLKDRRKTETRTRGFCKNVE